MLHSDFNRNILAGKTARRYFWFVPERICRFQSGRYSIFSQTISVLQPEFILGELMLGRLIKAPVQLLHISEAVPAKQMNGNSAVCLRSFIDDKGNYDQET